MEKKREKKQKQQQAERVDGLSVRGGGRERVLLTLGNVFQVWNRHRDKLKKGKEEIAGKGFCK